MSQHLVQNKLKCKKKYTLGDIYNLATAQRWKWHNKAILLLIL